MIVGWEEEGDVGVGDKEVWKGREWGVVIWGKEVLGYVFVGFGLELLFYWGLEVFGWGWGGCKVGVVDFGYF